MKSNTLFFYLESKWQLVKTNVRFWKCTKNKNNVTLDTFPNFAYVSSYLLTKSLVWKRDRHDITKTTNNLTLTKTFLERFIRVLWSKLNSIPWTCPYTFYRPFEFEFFHFPNLYNFCNALSKWMKLRFLESCHKPLKLLLS